MKDLVDVRAWTKQYPLAAVSSAAVAGFLLARAFNSRKTKHAEPSSDAQTDGAPPSDRREPAEKKEGPLQAGIDAALNSFISPLLQIATAAALTAVQEAVAPQPDSESPAEAPVDSGVASDVGDGTGTAD